MKDKVGKIVKILVKYTQSHNPFLLGIKQMSKLNNFKSKIQK